MSIEILMPALSPTMTEGNLSKWLVKKGDSVKAGDLIAEIETDKATMEVESVDEGIVLDLLFKEGDANIPVNKVIAILGNEVEKTKSKEVVKSSENNNNNNKEKEYLADNQNTEYQGTAAGGTIELSSKKNIKNASKIAEELYSRFNEEDRSLKDKQYIKNLLDWY